MCTTLVYDDLKFIRLAKTNATLNDKSMYVNQQKLCDIQNFIKITLNGIEVQCSEL